MILKMICFDLEKRFLLSTATNILYNLINLDSRASCHFDIGKAPDVNVRRPGNEVVT